MSSDDPTGMRQTIANLREENRKQKAEIMALRKIVGERKTTALIRRKPGAAPPSYDHG